MSSCMSIRNDASTQDLSKMFKSHYFKWSTRAASQIIMKLSILIFIVRCLFKAKMMRITGINFYLNYFNIH